MRARSKEKLGRTISELVKGLSLEEKRKLFDTVLEKEGVPLSIFRGELSGLEAIVLYLKDVERKSVSEIAKVLNRSAATIYNTYAKAKNKTKLPNKRKNKSRKKDQIDFIIPCRIFSNRRFSILEALVSHLKGERKLTLIRIARDLNKSPSTIKTVYWRYQKKCLNK